MRDVIAPLSIVPLAFIPYLLLEGGEVHQELVGALLPIVCVALQYLRALVQQRRVRRVEEKVLLVEELCDDAVLLLQGLSSADDIEELHLGVLVLIVELLLLNRN